MTNIIKKCPGLLCNPKQQQQHQQEDVHVDETERLVIRAFQHNPFHRIPRTHANENQRIRHWTNSIRTSQYRWWNFFPLNLFQQVIIPSNLYFLVMAILQLIRPISDSGGIPTFLLPISVVMAVTMMKDAYEDIKRHRSDALENNKVCSVLDAYGNLKEVNWKDLHPGDIVKVTATKEFPADLILLSCSDIYGISYCGTVQLDGETNLKDKTALPEIMEMFSDPHKLCRAKLEITYGPPSAKIYSFNGTLRLYSQHFVSTSQSPSLETICSAYTQTNSSQQQLSPSPSLLQKGSVIFTRRTVSDVHSINLDSVFEGIPYVEFPVNINQFLWRGATLSNTDWIYGLVVYTGDKTRIFQNAKPRFLKYSKLLKMYNKHAIVLACTQFALCLVAALIYTINSVSMAKNWYLQPNDDESLHNYNTYGLAGFLTSLGIGFGRFVLLLSYFVPITLFVQLEIIKWCQAYFLIKDTQIISPINQKGATVSTVSLMEELGSVTHIFSDKTGTLTLNLMQLKCIGIGHSLYGFEDADDPTFDTFLDVKEEAIHSEIDAEKLSVYRFRRNPNSYVDFDSFMMLKHIAKQSVEEKKRISDFLLILALCHSVLPKKNVVVEEVNVPNHLPHEQLETGHDALSSSSDTSSLETPPQTPKKTTSHNGSSSSRSLQNQTWQEVPEDSQDDEGGSESLNIPLFEILNGQSMSTVDDEPRHKITSIKLVEAKQTFSSRVVCCSPSQVSPPQNSISKKRQSDKCATTTPPSRVKEPPHEHLSPRKSHSSSSSSSEHPLVQEQQRSIIRSCASSRIEEPASSSDTTTTRGQKDVIMRKKKEELYQPVTNYSQNKPPYSLSSDQDLVKKRLKMVRWRHPTSANYDASSPDELALVAGAAHLGVEFLRRPNLNTIQIGLTNSVVRDLLLPENFKVFANSQKEALEISEFGTSFPLDDTTVDWVKYCRQKNDVPTATHIIPSLLFDVLEVLEFDNVRKKMSVIVKDVFGNLKLLTKGADSAMIADAYEENLEYLNELKNQLDDLSRKGLRTLVFGWRSLEAPIFKLFKTKLNKAKLVGSDDELTKAYDWIEKGLTLVGCTGIDDKLQPEVPRTIEDLRNAGVKLWVLTGDKVETAVSIGHSCNVLTESTYNATITGTSETEVLEHLQKYMKFIVAGQLAKEAFDQILTNQQHQGRMESVVEEDEIEESLPTTRCYNCIDRSLRPLGCIIPSTKKTKKKRKSKQPLVMSFEDFIKTITFQAKYKPVVSQPEQDKASPLNKDEIEQLIEEYLRAFGAAAGSHVPSDLMKKDSTGSNSKMSKSEQQQQPKKISSTTSSAKQKSNTIAMKLVDTLEVSEAVPKIERVEHHELACDVRETSNQSIPERDFSYTDWLSVISPKKPDSKILPNEKQFQRTTSHTAYPQKARLQSTREVERYTAVAITCTGEALTYILGNDSIKRYFFGLANLCATVIACRVTPKQKAEIVRQASRYLPGTVSLGIGDGANDVGMIITANVGVGICGKEGMQAVTAADFAIGEFRFLKNLMFHHGHENLRRNSLQVYQTVYKNVLFGLADWIFGFYSAFSAVDLYNTWLKQIYNLLYTSFPPLLFSVFDRRLPTDIFLNTPWLYPIALRNNGELYFGKQKFIIWFCFGLVSAIFVVLLPLGGIGFGSVRSDGINSIDIHGYGHTVFYLVVVVANFAVIPFFNTWFWFIALGYVLCFGIWFLTWGLCSGGASFCSDLRGTLTKLDLSIAWQLTVIITAVLVLGLLSCWWFYRIMFQPDPGTIIRERIAKGVFDVVVAPRRLGGLQVVVPRCEDGEEWRGFAFSEGMTRLQLHRRLSIIPKTVITQTAALGTAAGGIFYGSGPTRITDTTSQNIKNNNSPFLNSISELS